MQLEVHIKYQNGEDLNAVVTVGGRQAGISGF